jgi:hypothetical protein
MSQQQEHEMNMLMAKKAWDVGSKRVEQLSQEYDGLQVKISAAKEKLMGRSLEELIGASLEDGANPEQAAEIRDNTDIKSLDGLNGLARKYEDMISNEKATLGNLVSYNATALAGEKFGKDYKGAKGAKNYLETYDTEPETPGFLSPDERAKVKHAALNDMFLVEDIENKKEGTDYITVYADNKPVNVRPEGLAFVAGFESVGSAEERREKAVKARTKYGAPQQSMDEWLNLDATYMNLSQEERGAIDQALTTPGTPVPPELRDTVEQMKRMNKISVDLAGSKMGEYAQPLPDSVFEPERDPTWYLPESKEARIQKPWTQYEVNGKINPGLTKELYDSIRKLGTNARDERKALEYTIRNWDDIAPEKRNAYILQIISQHSGIIAELSK